MMLQMRRSESMMSPLRIAALLGFICACGFPPPPDVGGDAGPPLGDFAVSVASPRVRIAEGTSATVGVTIDRNAFTEAVTVTVGGLPAGVTVNPLMITADTGTLTLSVAGGATQGDAALTVTATGGTRSHEVPLSLLAMGQPGTLDKSFSAAGTLLTPPTGLGFAMVIQPDGKIVVAGHTAGATPKVLVARFLPSGALDPAFAGGVVTLASGNNDFGAAVALQPDAKIVVAGATTPGDLNARHGLIVRFNADGTTDLGFGTGGRVELGLGPSEAAFTNLRAVVVQPDGGIVVAGIASVVDGDFDAVVARLAPGGGLDNSFGIGNGRIQLPLGPGIDGFAALGLQPDGRIVAFGTTEQGSANIATFVRLTSAGLPDSTFGADGKILIDSWEARDATGYLWGASVAFQPDGKIVAAGSAFSGTGDNACLVRLNGSEGSRDTGFGPDGVKVVSLTPGRFDRVIGLALQPDGKLVLGGSVPIAASSSNFDAVVARFGSSGLLDLGFGTGGITAREIATEVNAIDQPRAIALDADGRIVTAGFFLSAPDPEKLLLARFWP
jgi:uncharacterized delta-60 repeat protein